MKPLTTTLALLLLAGCSSLQASPAPSASLVPAPVVITVEQQDQIPALMDALSEGHPLTAEQRKLNLTLIRLLYVEREKLRSARIALKQN